MATNEVDAAAAARQWFEAHLRSYLESGGARGHLLDFSPMGGHLLTTNLLLKTTGRRTGESRVLPLIYGLVGGEAVIVASKGGSDTHPAWYLNLQGSPEVEFQIATQAFRASWREPQGVERRAAWEHMAGLYPPYRDYQLKTKREIPLVMLKPVAEVAVFKAAGGRAGA